MKKTMIFMAMLMFLGCGGKASEEELAPSSARLIMLQGTNIEVDGEPFKGAMFACVDFVVDSSECLVLLRGFDGQDGVSGNDGASGNDGSMGPQGPQGPSGTDGFLEDDDDGSSED